MNSKPVTPLPWTTGRPAKGCVYTLADNTPALAITSHACGTEAQYGDAKYIVHAANAYPKLVAALQLALVRMEDLACAAPKQEAETDRHAETMRAVLRELGEVQS